MPPIDVVADGLSEDRPVGPTGRPEWTSARRFSTTRVYLQKSPGEIGFEQWFRGRLYRDGKNQYRFQEELEIGLPCRMQLDLYQTWFVESEKGETNTWHQDIAVELRYALADWGKIPLNPTLYGEWKFSMHDDDPDVYELKLLLGEDFGKLHWGFNAIYEQEVGGARATEMAWSQGLSYTMIDSCLSIGVEMSFKHETEKGSRHKPEIKFAVGPSVQWRPTPWSHIDVVPLIGCTKDAPGLEAFVIFGIDLGGFEDGHYAPVSLLNN